jgi:hypothetical protein
MTLWHLQAIDRNKGPWDRWYDTTDAFVIRADSEEEARAMTKKNAGDEVEYNKGKNPWLDPGLTSCVELTLDGEPTVVIYSFNAG